MNVFRVLDQTRPSKNPSHRVLDQTRPSKNSSQILSSCCLGSQCKGVIFFKFFLGFSQVFACFSLDFCKGRISKNNVQIALKPAQILPLGISFVLTPAMICFVGGCSGNLEGICGDPSLTKIQGKT